MTPQNKKENMLKSGVSTPSGMWVLLVFKATCGGASVSRAGPRVGVPGVRYRPLSLQREAPCLWEPPAVGLWAGDGVLGETAFLQILCCRGAVELVFRGNCPSRSCRFGVSCGRGWIQGLPTLPSWTTSISFLIVDFLIALYILDTSPMSEVWLANTVDPWTTWRSETPALNSWNSECSFTGGPLCPPFASLDSAVGCTALWVFIEKNLPLSGPVCGRVLYHSRVNCIFYHPVTCLLNFN